MREADKDAEWRGILLFAETADGKVEKRSLLAIEKLRDLAGELGVYVDAVLAGIDLADSAKELIAYGASKVLTAEDERFRNYDTQELVALTSAVIHSRRPEAVVFPDSFAARDLGPRLAQRFQTSFVPACTGLGVEERQRKIIQTRRMFGGKVTVRFLTTVNAPQFFSVGVDTTMEPYEADYPRGQVIALTGFGTA